MVYAFSENYVLPISHDEVVHGKGSLLRKMPGDRWQQLANVRAFLSWQWAHPGKQLLFMGQEFAQDHEWAEQRELDWGLLDDPGTRACSRLVADLNSVYVDTPALWSQDTSPDGFQWIDADDAGGNRWRSCAGGPTAAPWCASPTSPPCPHEGYQLGLPFAGEWTEVINTDAEIYGGSGVGNLGTVTAHANPHDGQPASARLRVPPLGTLWLTSTQRVERCVRVRLRPVTAGLLDVAERVWPVLLFLALIQVVADLCDDAGLFDVSAHVAARVAGGSRLALFLLFTALATVSTWVLSIDTTAVLLAPIGLALAAELGLSALPFAFASIWLANAAALLLPVSNLTNLLAQ